MALIKCPQCGNMISDRAAKCPKCGTPIHGDENVVRPAQASQKTAERESVTQERRQKVKPQPQGMSVGKRTLLYGVFAVLLVILGTYFFLQNKNEKGMNDDATESPQELVETQTVCETAEAPQEEVSAVEFAEEYVADTIEVAEEETEAEPSEEDVKK